MRGMAGEGGGVGRSDLGGRMGVIAGDQGIGGSKPAVGLLPSGTAVIAVLSEMWGRLPPRSSLECALSSFHA